MMSISAFGLASLRDISNDMFMPKKTRIAIYSVRAALGVRGYWRVQVAAWLSHARASSASAGKR
jgi:hypothetical protein